MTVQQSTVDNVDNVDNVDTDVLQDPAARPWFVLPAGPAEQEGGGQWGVLVPGQQQCGECHQQERTPSSSL